jgi:hypothetical protein
MNKTRKTVIVAHKAKKTLENLFPDMTMNHELLIYASTGEVLDKCAFTPLAAKDELLKKYAQIAGFVTQVVDEEYQYSGYIRLGERCLRVERMGERKCGVVFTSTKDEAEHYEEVDEIVKDLAKKDVAVLRGECEITITTRC